VEDGRPAAKLRVECRHGYPAGDLEEELAALSAAVHVTELFRTAPAIGK
jgi:hypothetical protein